MIRYATDVAPETGMSTMKINVGTATRPLEKIFIHECPANPPCLRVPQHLLLLAVHRRHWTIWARALEAWAQGQRAGRLLVLHQEQEGKKHPKPCLALSRGFYLFNMGPTQSPCLSKQCPALLQSDNFSRKELSVIFVTRKINAGHASLTEDMISSIQIPIDCSSRSSLFTMSSISVSYNDGSLPTNSIKSMIAKYPPNSASSPTLLLGMVTGVTPSTVMTRNKTQIGTPTGTANNTVSCTLSSGLLFNCQQDFLDGALGYQKTTAYLYLCFGGLNIALGSTVYWILPSSTRGLETTKVSSDPE